MHAQAPWSIRVCGGGHRHVRDGCACVGHDRRQGRQCLAAGGDAAGADDGGAGTGPVLRRPGAGEEHPLGADAGAGGGVAGDRAVDRLRLQPGVRGRQRMDRWLRKWLLAGVGPDSALATFSAGVQVPELIYVAFQGAFAAISCALVVGAIAERAQLRRGAAVHRAVVHLRLPAAGAHGVGRRWLPVRERARWISPAAPWCTSTPASPGWSARTCSGRASASVASACHRTACRWHSPARPAVGRLVRIQRRLRARSQRHGSARLPQYPGRAGSGGVVVERARVEAARTRIDAGCRIRRRVGTGGDHAGLRHGRRRRRDGDRRARRYRRLLGRQRAQALAARGRFARRIRHPRRLRHRRRTAHRCVHRAIAGRHRRRRLRGLRRSSACRRSAS